MKVWREGARIRRDDGTGYGDTVTDAALWKRVAADLATLQDRLDSALFAFETLRLRTQERDESSDADGGGS